MIGYKVGKNLFFNVYLALYESMKSKEQVQFICHDEQYQHYDWREEPPQSLDELMTKHAFDLRHKYERIILGWSGGTDSHTIYRIFKQNNIHIDEILIKTSNKLEQYPECHFSWMKKNHHDRHTIITKYDHHDSHLKQIECNNEHWIFKNKGDLTIFGQSTGADGTRHMIEKNHSGKKWIYVAGFEKPRLVFRKNRWWARQLDFPLRLAMGYDYIDCFFLDPLINIKQSHLLKKAVKEKIKKNNLTVYENDWAESKWDHNNRHGYKEWATACGRDPELSDGASHLQKIMGEQYRKILISNGNVKISNDPIFNGYLDSSDKSAINFLKGVCNLKSEKQFVNFLHQNSYLRARNQLLDISFFWTKEYDIGI